MSARAKIYFILGIDLAALFFQILYWKHPFVGWFSFGIFLWTTGVLWRSFFSRVYKIAPTSLVARILGPFTSWIFVTFFGAVAVVWYTTTPLLTWIALFLSAAVAVTASYIEKGKRFKRDIDAPSLRSSFKVFSCHPTLCISFFIIAGLLALALISSTGSGVQFSPWQSLHSFVLPLTFLLTLVIGLLLFAKSKPATVLGVLIVHSLLLHAYLPLSHQIPWGGDVWRHIAAESQLVAGEAILPVLIGEDAQYREMLGVLVPEALLIPHKYIYGQFWASAAIAAHVTQIDLFSFNIWYLPLLWGLVFPAVVFYFGQTVFGSIQKGLLLVYASSFPFIFQALGAFTLPTSLGFLVFIFILSLWLQMLRTGRVRQALLPIIFSTCFIFGYTMYTVLLWGVIAATFIFLFAKRIKHRLVTVSSKTFIYVSALLSFPLIDAYVGGSQLPVQLSFLEQAKRAVGELSGWYIARAIRPHDIASGNIFYNHVPELAYVDTIFTTMRWHLLIIIVLMGVFALIGFVLMIRSRSTVQHLLATLGFAVIGGYIIGWYVLVGDRLFVRRLDPVFALLVLTYAIIGLEWCIGHAAGQVRLKKRSKRVLAACCILLFSWGVTTTYALGPDTRVLSTNEVAGAEYLLQATDPESQACVIADTWMLLALEGLSHGKIVGGGFPIEANFAQAERSVIYAEMQINPRLAVLEFSQLITGAEHCAYAVPKEAISEELIALISELYIDPPKEIGDIIIWK